MKFAPKNASTVALLCAAALSLTGCGSGEPSNADIQGALRAAEPTADPKLAEKLVKIGCKEDGKNSYRCDIGSKEGSGTVVPVRFVKTDAGWRVATGS